MLSMDSFTLSEEMILLNQQGAPAICLPQSLLGTVRPGPSIHDGTFEGYATAINGDLCPFLQRVPFHCPAVGRYGRPFTLHPAIDWGHRFRFWMNRLKHAQS